MTPTRSALQFARLSALTLAFAALAACSSTPSRQSVGERVDDAAITAGIKARLVADPTLKATEVNVKTFKGEVQLSGFVGDPGDRARAERLALDSPGVVSVRNEMRLKGSEPSTVGSYIDDAAVTAKIKASLLANSGQTFSEVKVETFHGVAQLSGFVSDPRDKHRAVDIARGVNGVRSVKDDMSVRGR